VKSSLSRVLPLVEYGVSSVTAEGQIESGDSFLVTPIQDGLLLAVVDGAGHGAEAAKTSRLAIETLYQHADEDVIPLIRRCHERLRGSRGAVLGVMCIHGLDSTLTWLGVGNVEGVLLRDSPSVNPRVETMRLRPGVAGYRLPALQVARTPIAPGDLLILLTDGIRHDFVREFSSGDQPGKIAEYISSNFWRGVDDGLVLVARYLGSTQ
jgi:phosphoserine phosphatase RsbX